MTSLLVSAAASGFIGASPSPEMTALGMTAAVSGLGFLATLSILGGRRGSAGRSTSDTVREPVFAGSWYAGDPEVLSANLDRHLSGADRPPWPSPEGARDARAWVLEGRFPQALVVPHAGHTYSGDCAGAVYRLLQGGRYRRVLLLAPSHYIPLRGAALPGSTAFRTPLGILPLDLDTLRTLETQEGFQVLPSAHAQEHAIEIELPFLQKVLPPDFLLVPIVIGRISLSELAAIGTALANCWDEDSLLVASSDFTHYGPNFDYVPFADRVPDRLRDLDLGAIELVLQRDGAGFEAYRERTGITICGAEPIRVLFSAAEGRDLQGRLVDYYRSGDKLGEFDHSVSYAGIAFFGPGPTPVSTVGATGAASTRVPTVGATGTASMRVPTAGATGTASMRVPTVGSPGTASMHVPPAGATGPAIAPSDASDVWPDRDALTLDREEQAFLLSLAREVLMRPPREQPHSGSRNFQAAEPGAPRADVPVPDRFRADSPLRQRWGVFVTLLRRSDGSLRGCIGDVFGELPLATGVEVHSDAAARRDPRFPMVRPEELPDLCIEISVLGRLRTVLDLDEIQLGRDGVLLEKDGRRAVFLPKVGLEQGWDRAELLAQLARKAGLRREEWEHGARISIFQAQVFIEEGA